ncbi:hypothetical protein rosag_12120 [Roseisolibacter agri]|uniref:Uncharacterized protein n=1 Tax=Roseisolibacter agri TaxID=2014610 RepID=A0AA37Q1M0_9BACT|nr:hypothetical protein rosag_12120 [Roseisolibacter agri]
MPLGSGDAPGRHARRTRRLTQDSRGAGRRDRWRPPGVHGRGWRLPAGLYETQRAPISHAAAHVPSGARAA